MNFCFQIGVAASTLLALGPASARAAGPSGALAVTRVDPRSGQEIKTIVVKPMAPRFRIPDAKPVDAASISTMKSIVEEAAAKYDVNPALVDSVIQVESNYNPNAVSVKGAAGLMQLMPATAQRFGVKDPFDPRENIHGGVKYLKFLQETFKDDKLAIAAYNAGEGAVTKYNNNVPPYAETVNYVAQVGKRYGKAKKSAAAKREAAVAQAKVEEPAAPKYSAVRSYVGSDGKTYLTTQ